MLKECRICHITKSINDFYQVSKKRTNRGDGHDTRCKECVLAHIKSPEARQRANELRREKGKSEKAKEANRQWAKKYYATELGKQKARDKSKRHYWRNREQCLSEQALFRQTEAYKKSVREYREKYPEKRKAQIAVMNAIASRHLIRPSTCSVCQEPCKPDAHHFDYSKPLEVIWVCRKCHAAYRGLT